MAWAKMGDRSGRRWTWWRQPWRRRRARASPPIINMCPNGNAPCNLAREYAFGLVSGSRVLTDCLSYVGLMRSCMIVWNGSGALYYRGLHGFIVRVLCCFLYHSVILDTIDELCGSCLLRTFANVTEGFLLELKFTIFSGKRCELEVKPLSRAGWRTNTGRRCWALSTDIFLDNGTLQLSVSGVELEVAPKHSRGSHTEVQN